jgi:2-polyprenyl-3-methyl-5-hydroxy-6-metoxy-1,4-benzoquinol methylase
MKNYENMTKEFVLALQKMKSNYLKTIEKSLSQLSYYESLELEKLLTYYINTLHLTIADIAEKYVAYMAVMAEYQLYFLRNGYKYRYSTYEEIEHFYTDKVYMENYTVWLGLSLYLLPANLAMIRFFKNFVTGGGGCKESYFEIGPGHGEYLGQAILNGNFKKYRAIDISESSVIATNQFIESLDVGHHFNYDVSQGDFLEYSTSERYDVIVMGEVLEHVETPTEFLKKAHYLLKTDGELFVSTAINSPDPDHIYQFHNMNEVCEIFTQSGLSIIEQSMSIHGNISLEQAEKRHLPIVVGFILGKTE